jgi:hypothetical protein
MFTQTMIQNLGALKVGWYWLSMMLVHGIGRVRKLKQEE